MNSLKGRDYCFKCQQCFDNDGEMIRCPKCYPSPNCYPGHHPKNKEAKKKMEHLPYDPPELGKAVPKNLVRVEYIDGHIPSASEYLPTRVSRLQHYLVLQYPDRDRPGDSYPIMSMSSLTIGGVETPIPEEDGVIWKATEE